MTSRPTWLVLLAVAGTAYLAGHLQARFVIHAAAQESDGPSLPSDEALKKIVAANDALKIAAEGLRQDQRYAAVTKAVNPYAILTGGLNALEDLESGRGVDPYTFASLYAGDASDEIKGFLATDEEGRLTYKNKVIRMYSVSRLKKAELMRQLVLGETKKDQKEE
jgi:hypothetical protein